MEKVFFFCKVKVKVSPFSWLIIFLLFIFNIDDYGLQLVKIKSPASQNILTIFTFYSESENFRYWICTVLRRALITMMERLPKWQLSRIDTLHREGKSQKVVLERAGCCHFCKRSPDQVYLFFFFMSFKPLSSRFKHKKATLSWYSIFFLDAPLMQYAL